jgi:hypothetical protein
MRGHLKEYDPSTVLLLNYLNHNIITILVLDPNNLYDRKFKFRLNIIFIGAVTNTSTNLLKAFVATNDFIAYPRFWIIYQDSNPTSLPNI